MDAKEFMLGNLIFVEKSQQVGKINYITTTSIGYGEKNFAPIDSFLGYFNPIPLTRDILLNSGFEKIRTKRGVLETFSDCGVKINLSNSGFFYYGNTIIRFVHQLQNLFYALKREELEIQLYN